MTISSMSFSTAAFLTAVVFHDLPPEKWFLCPLTMGLHQIYPSQPLAFRRSIVFAAS